MLATLGVDIEFLDAGGTEITDTVLRGETVTVQVNVQDVRAAGQGDAAGVIALPLEYAWDPAQLAAIRSFDNLDPLSLADELVTNNFPLQRVANTASDTVSNPFVLTVRGGALPNLQPPVGQAIGVTEAERFSTVDFVASSNASEATFQVSLDGALSFADADALDAVEGLDRTVNVPGIANTVQASIGIVGGSLGGINFNDIDGNGIQDAGEPGLAGVTIRLDPTADGEPTLEVLTADDGTYLFDDLPQGTYTLSEVIPAGQVITVPTDNEYVVTLTNDNRDVSNLDFGNQAIATTTVSGIKFNDINGNGIREIGENGVPNITIVLDRLNDDLPVVTTTTDANGNFQFENVTAGMYAVSEVLPDQTIQTTPVDVFTIDVNPPTSVDGLEFGNFSLSTLGGVKFEDIDGDGVQDDDEPVLPGVTINLDLDDDGTVDQTVVTGADGRYQFEGVGPGTHRITEVVPVGFEPTAPDVNGIVVDSLSGATIDDLNFGNRRIDDGLASVSGFVFVDTDFDSVFEPQEFGLPGVTVQLIDSVGAITETVTSARGSYRFDGLDPGSYRIVEIQPDGYADASISLGNVLPSGQTTGAADGLNAFNEIVLAPNTTAIDYNFGEVLTAVTKRFFLASTDARGELASNVSPTEFRIRGTTGDDLITIENLDADGVQISINDQAPVIVPPAQAASILIDGLSGDDRIDFLGSSQVESFDLTPGELAIQTNAQSIGVFSVEDIRVQGGGGEDQAVLRDSDGVDQLNAQGDVVALFTGAGPRIGISNVPRVQAVSPIDTPIDTTDIDAIDFVLELAGDWQSV